MNQSELNLSGKEDNHPSIKSHSVSLEASGIIQRPGSQADKHEIDERLSRRLSNLFQALPGAVLMLNGEGRIEQCNPAANELFGETLIDEYWRDIVSRYFAPRWDDGHDISLVNGRIVNIATQPMLDEPGQILLIKDVTETRELQNQLNRARRLSAKGEMAAALAHQIRTPLASAILYVSNLSNKKLDIKGRENFTGKCLSRLNYLEKLIEDMLLFARGGNFQLKEIPIDTLMEQFQQQIEPLLKENDCEWVVDIKNRHDLLLVNSSAIISVLQNLVENAIQAVGARQKTDKIPEPGRLQLNVSSQADMVQISLSDNGTGIPENIRNTLFEPFVTTRANGTGLGLSVAQAVVRSHGGGISVGEIKPHGTRFEVRLPLFRGKNCLNKNKQELK